MALKFQAARVNFLLLCFKSRSSGARRGGEDPPPPPETEKIVVEKWCYFPELYKMTKVTVDEIENG